MKGVIDNIVTAEKTLFTLQFPAQPQVSQQEIRPSEAQLVVFTENHEAYRGVKNAFDLLDVLYRRGITDTRVLALALEATGHRENSEPRPHVDTSSATEENAHDPR